ncbi:MAG: hypothetical protein A2Y38_08445 [Spirochaetes bacterium GWB1_59_5]|nr:MAG: hypothetical protein A2Y38_08445 [Spirochaetes bacterium GWB1_59_5]
MNPSELTQVFAFDDNMIRIAGSSDDPLFFAVDVCRALGIENHRDALASGIPEDEKGVETFYSLGGPQQTLMLRESGLYRLIFRSTKPEAERFRSWVFKEVLPAIRKTGKYSCNPEQQHLWEAYHVAKTGRVQWAILQALKIVGGSPDGSLGLISRGAESSRFWTHVLGCLESGDLPADNFRIRPCALPHGEEWFQLNLWPEPVIQAVKTRSSDYGKFARSDFLAMLQTESGWRGAQNYRIGPGNDCLSTWSFEARPDGREMYAVCSFLWRAKLAEAAPLTISPVK